MNRWSRPLALAAGLLSIIGLVVYDNDTTPVRSDDVLQSVVAVRAMGCGLEAAIGTGVLVEHDGETLVVTSAHTVAGATEASIEQQFQERLDSTVLSPTAVVGFDPDRDVAILRLDSGWPFVEGRSLADPSTGDVVTAMPWVPGGAEFESTTITRLLRVTIEDIYIEDEVERRAFEFGGAITAGDSGAPVFTDDGDVVGIVYARSRERDVGFAVSATEIRPVLETVSDQPVDTGRCL